MSYYDDGFARAQAAQAERSGVPGGVRVRTLESFDQGGFGPRRKQVADDWGRDRKKAIRYIGKTCRLDFMTAECLLYRTEIAGVPWDKVNWDALGGGDLSYDEMVSRLNRLLGRASFTKGELEEIERNHRWLEKMAAEDPEKWSDDLERSQRALMEAYSSP